MASRTFVGFTKEEIYIPPPPGFLQPAKYEYLGLFTTNTWAISAKYLLMKNNGFSPNQLASS